MAPLDESPVPTMVRLLQGAAALAALAGTIASWSALDTGARKAVVIATALLAILLAALFPGSIRGRHITVTVVIAGLLGAGLASTFALLRPEVVDNLAGPSKPRASASAPPASPRCGINILREPWKLVGHGGDAQAESEPADPQALAGNDRILIEYDLHGHSFGVGIRHDESAIAFYHANDPARFNVDLSRYVDEPSDGWHSLYVPMSDFIGLAENGQDLTGGRLDPNRPIDRIWTRFWSDTPFVVEVRTIRACKAS